MIQKCRRRNRSVRFFTVNTLMIRSLPLSRSGCMISEHRIIDMRAVRDIHTVCNATGRQRLQKSDTTSRIQGDQSKTQILMRDHLL